MVNAVAHTDGVLVKHRHQNIHIYAAKDTLIYGKLIIIVKVKQGFNYNVLVITL